MLFDPSIYRGFAYFFAYHFADASISQRFSPSFFFSRNSRTSLSTSARKCTSLNLSLTWYLGPNNWTPNSNFGSLPLFIITTILWEPFRRGLSCLSDSLSSFPLGLLNHCGVIPYFTPNAANNGWHQFWSHLLPKLTPIFFTFFLEHFTACFSTAYFLLVLIENCAPLVQRKIYF